MSIALTAEHEQLRDVAARWLTAHCPRDVVRAGLDAVEHPQPAVRELAELAAGFGLLELCIVVEQAGRAMLPGALLPTMVVGTLLDRTDAWPKAREAVAGGATATVAWRADE